MTRIPPLKGSGIKYKRFAMMRKMIRSFVKYTPMEPRRRLVMDKVLETMACNVGIMERVNIRMTEELVAKDLKYGIAKVAVPTWERLQDKTETEIEGWFSRIENVLWVIRSIREQII